MENFSSCMWILLMASLAKGILGQIYQWIILEKCLDQKTVVGATPEWQCLYSLAVDLAVFGGWLDLLILKAFSNQNNYLIPCFYH